MNDDITGPHPLAHQHRQRRRRSCAVDHHGAVEMVRPTLLIMADPIGVRCATRAEDVGIEHRLVRMHEVEALSSNHALCHRGDEGGPQEPWRLVARESL